VFTRSGDLRLVSTGLVVELAASQPSWSPDGKKLAFVKGGNIQTCTVSSGSCGALTDTGVAGSEPVWSPDGTKIAFVTGSTIHTMTSSGGSDTAITSTTTDASPSWSADGSQLVYTRNGAIAKVVASAGGTVTVITTTGVSSSAQPAWSPDGSTIAFESSSQIYVVAAAGGTVTQVTTSTTDSAPSWSPDGTGIVFARSSGIYEVTQSGGAWGTPSQLTTTAGDATPDRQTIAPVAASAPTITGGLSPQTGHQLTATNGSWKGASSTGYSYQWQRCNSSGASCSSIGGATAQTYAIVSADVGNTLRVVVTASNPAGSTASTASNATGVVAQAGVVNAPSNTAAPTISLPSGQTSTAPLIGTTLTASVGTWTGSFPLTYTYQWKHCEPNDTLNGPCFRIIGETSNTLVVPPSLYGRRLRVEVTATNSAASVAANSAASEIVTATAPVLSVTPQILGQNIVGQTLSLTSGTWTGSSPTSASRSASGSPGRTRPGRRWRSRTTPSPSSTWPTSPRQRPSSRRSPGRR
jgi:TolB protein